MAAECGGPWTAGVCECRNVYQPPTPITATTNAIKTRRLFDLLLVATTRAGGWGAVARPLCTAGGVSTNVAFGSLPAAATSGGALFKPIEVLIARSSPRSRAKSSPVW